MFRKVMNKLSATIVTERNIRDVVTREIIPVLASTRDMANRIFGDVTIVDGNYSMQPSDWIVVIEAGTSVTLPSVSEVARAIIVVNKTLVAISVSALDGETVEEASSIAVPAGIGKMLIADDSRLNWVDCGV